VLSDDLVAATRPRHPVRTPLTDLVGWLRAATADAGLETRGELGPTEVTGISLSSQRILPGDLYAALPGARAHGIEFAGTAVAAGAVAVLTDPAGADTDAARCGVPLLVVERPRAVLGRLAARVYGDPATGLRMIGVTGTQGKTTTTRLAEGGLQQAGVPAAVIGTVGTRVAGEDLKTALTTPEAPDLHGLFAMMRERHVAACAMEVSSHALVMGRVGGFTFDVGSSSTSAATTSTSTATWRTTSTRSGGCSWATTRLRRRSTSATPTAGALPTSCASRARRSSPSA